MKYTFTALLTLCATLASSGTGTAASISNLPGLDAYVYPANVPKAPAPMTWMADGLTYLQLSADRTRVEQHDTRTGEVVETVMDCTHTRENTIASIEAFTLSPDGSKLLITAKSRPVYRRSSEGQYYVYEIRTRVLSQLSTNHEWQRSPVFSPDGRMVAFAASDGNIYLKKIDFKTETALTKDGAPGNIINGVPDWVYEEEFATSCSMVWAPDNATLCYLKYDESDVPAFGFPLYEGTCDPMKQYALYPGEFSCKYPVAGQPNSKVTVHSFDIDNRKTKDLTIPASYEYIPRIAYAASPDRLAVVTLNRAQNRMEVFAVNPRANTAKSILVEQEEAWLEPCTYEDINFGTDGFTVLSARTGYVHAYSYTYAGALLGAISKGDFNVTAYLGADAKGNRYVQSSATGSTDRVVSRIDAKGIMTHITPEHGWASASFAPAMNYCVINYSDVTTPPTYTLTATPAAKQGRVLEDNKVLASAHASDPRREFTTLTVAPGVDVNAYIIKPSNFNSSKRYPLILSQYSGPGSQQVTNKWSAGWEEFAAMQGYVVACVDPRGTGGRSRKFQTVVYRNLGHYESIDLREAARLLGQLPYVDPSRIGITGWSYGGYETLMAVSSAENPFAAAVAVAPVTSWRYYDSIYTERYMLTPGENEDGYNQSAPLSHVDKMNIPLLIMHGTADDNVHFSNTVQYVSALQSAGKWCDMFIYPNMNHSIYGCDARLSVYSRLLTYFNSNI